MLADEFLFRVPGIGCAVERWVMRSVHSNVVLENQKNETLLHQYDVICMEYYSHVEGINPTTQCSDIEESMYSWIGFKKYVWMEEEVVNGTVFPKIAVLRGKKL